MTHDAGQIPMPIRYTHLAGENNDRAGRASVCTGVRNTSHKGGIGG